MNRGTGLVCRQVMHAHMHTGSASWKRQAGSEKESRGFRSVTEMTSQHARNLTKNKTTAMRESPLPLPSTRPTLSLVQARKREPLLRGSHVQEHRETHRNAL